MGDLHIELTSNKTDWLRFCEILEHWTRSEKNLAVEPNVWALDVDDLTREAIIIFIFTSSINIMLFLSLICLCHLLLCITLGCKLLWNKQRNNFLFFIQFKNIQTHFMWRSFQIWKIWFKWINSGGMSRYLIFFLFYFLISKTQSISCS